MSDGATPDDDPRVVLPDDIDVALAQEIQQALRRRLGHGAGGTDDA